MATLGEIGPFIEGEDEFESYVRRLEMFFLANQVDDERKVATLLSVIGKKTFNLVENLISPKEPKDCTYDQVVKTLKAHFKPKKLLIIERYNFHQRKQSASETIPQYVAALRALGGTCEYGDVLETLLFDRFVAGLRNESTVRAILTSEKMTFQEAVELAVARETAANHARVLQSNHSDTQSVHSVKSNSQMQMEKKKPWENTSPNRIRQNSNRGRENPRTNKPKSACMGCNGWHWRNECPFREAECNKCHKTGHIAKACYAKLNSLSQVQESQDRENSILETALDGNNSYPIEYIHYGSDPSSEPYIVQLKVNNTIVDFEVDTGAARTVMAKSVFDQTFGTKPKMREATVRLMKYGEVPLKLKGEALVQVSGNEACKALPLVIADEEGPTLLGRDWLSALGFKDKMLKEVQIHAQQVVENGEISNIMDEFRELFDQSSMGQLKDVEVTLEVDPNIPPKFCNARPLPHLLKEKVESELEKLQEENIITPVTHSKWAAPIVPVLKQNKSVRICGDYRLTCNKALLIDRYPIPRVDELLGTLAGGKYFTKLDMSQAYMQLTLDNSSKPLTTINTHKGLFEYNRLCYGIASAPGIFQRTMESLLGGIAGVALFLDDILISGKTKKEHIERLRMVLGRLRDAGVKLGKDKCTWMTTSVEYLGYIVDDKGIHPTEDKLKAIKEAPAPKDETQLRSYLGLLNFYRKFLPRAATVLEPLNKLLRSKESFSWGREQQLAFAESKELLMNSTALVHYDPKLPIVVSADSSSYGIGAVMSHRIDNVDRPVYFISRTLTETERNYPQLEREALALVFAVKKFHYYLWGQAFTLITDHKPLLGVFSPDKHISPMASGRIQRWALILQGYRFDLVHCSGKYLGNADALSRLPLAYDNENIPIPAEWINSVELLDSTPVTAEQIRSWTKVDPVLREVLQYCKQGWPNKVESELQPFKNRQTELSVLKDCIMWGHRVVIPNKGRSTLIEELHAEHLGASKMKELARNYFWWPGLDGELETLVQRCSLCLENRSSPKKSPLHPWEWPVTPWHRVHIDYAGPINSMYYLIIVDAHSKWVEIFPTSSITSTCTISLLRSCFARWGLPVVLVSDNGTCFTSSEFQEFVQKNGIRHVRSAPFHPSSNGLAENMVRTFKAAVSHSKGEGMRLALDRFLFKYRITPHTTTGVSPSELLLGRQVRTIYDLLKPSDAIEQRVIQQQIKQKAYRDPKAPRAVELESGDNVMVRNYNKLKSEWVPATVEMRTGPVSYEVRTSDGQSMKRHLDQVITYDAKEEDNPPEPERPIIPEQSTLRRSTRASKAPDRLDL